MRILSVNNTADLYGASRCLERLLRQFAAAGHEVHVVLPENGPLVQLMEAGGVHVHIHAGLSVVDRTRVRSAWGALLLAIGLPLSVLRLALLILHLRINVVHTNTVVIPSAALAARITRVPHVWHVREMLAEFGSLWGLFQRVVTGLSASVIAVSECVRQQFAPSLRDHVTVIYDGLGRDAEIIDGEYRESIRHLFPMDAALVGVMGRIKFHRKGQEVFVHAVNLLKQKHAHVHFVIAGSPSPNNPGELDRLHSLIEELGVRERISLLGEITNPASLFAALDIAVIPSVQPEPFGCVVIEAMAVGTPVIGSACGGIAEQIVNEHSGLLFEPGDAAALAAAVDRMLSDDNLRSYIARNGLERVRTFFRAEDTYHSTLLLFEAVRERYA